MKITIFHSAMVESCRNLAQEVGFDPQLCQEEALTVEKDGFTVTVLSKHSAVVAHRQNFSGYPFCEYVDSQGGIHAITAFFNWDDLKLKANEIERGVA